MWSARWPARHPHLDRMPHRPQHDARQQDEPRAGQQRARQADQTALAALLMSCILLLMFVIPLFMALANVAGSLAGTHLALKHGTGFVRSVFIAVVSALILKTAYDAFLRGL